MEETELKLNLLPYHFSNENFNSLQILLGAKRYFIDEKDKQLWIPDQPYRKGSWGSVGGQPFKAGNDRMSYGSDKNILGTDLDPIFQTQQVDLKQYKLDVPDGEYELTLYFSELLGGVEKEVLAYNLDHKKNREEKEQRVFSLKVNEVLFLENFNISAEYGVPSESAWILFLYWVSRF
jgi:beta-galactosidase